MISFDVSGIEFSYQCFLINIDLDDRESAKGLACENIVVKKSCLAKL